MHKTLMNCLFAIIVTGVLSVAACVKQPEPTTIKTKDGKEITIQPRKHSSVLWREELTPNTTLYMVSIDGRKFVIVNGINGRAITDW